jgi:hypothetical protein
LAPHQRSGAFRQYFLELDSVHPEIGKFGRDQGARKI